MPLPGCHSTYFEKGMVIFMENIPEFYDDTKKAEPGHYKKLAKEAELREQWADQIEKQAAAIIKSEQLRTQINHAISGSQGDSQILLMALECIGLITGDHTMVSTYCRKMKQ